MPGGQSRAARLTLATLFLAHDPARALEEATAANYRRPRKRANTEQLTAELQACFEGSRLVPCAEGPKRGLKRGQTLPLSCTNTVEVQVNLDGGMQAKLLPVRRPGDSR